VLDRFVVTGCGRSGTRHEASRRATGISWSPAWEQHDGALAARAWRLADDLGLGPDEEVTSG